MISVILPAYNEEKIIEEITKRVYGVSLSIEKQLIVDVCFYTGEEN